MVNEYFKAEMIYDDQVMFVILCVFMLAERLIYHPLPELSAGSILFFMFLAVFSRVGPSSSDLYMILLSLLWGSLSIWMRGLLFGNFHVLRI